MLAHNDKTGLRRHCDFIEVQARRRKVFAENHWLIMVMGYTLCVFIDASECPIASLGHDA